MALVYEPEHFGSILEHMNPEDLFFDVGAFDGQTSLIVGEKVGPRNVAIIEPAEFNWSFIRKNWEAVYPDDLPRAMFPGFMDARDKPGSKVYFEWPPECANPLREADKLDFRWLHYCREDESCEALPRLTIDTLARVIGAPKGIQIDIEGAELLALRGAMGLLETHHPFVWVSVHPLFMKDRFGHDERQLHGLMSDLGYEGTLLKRDHEDHFCFQPK